MLFDAPLTLALGVLYIFFALPGLQATPLPLGIGNVAYAQNVPGYQVVADAFPRAEQHLKNLQYLLTVHPNQNFRHVVVASLIAEKVWGNVQGQQRVEILNNIAFVLDRRNTVGIEMRAMPVLPNGMIPAACVEWYNGWAPSTRNVIVFSQYFPLLIKSDQDGVVIHELMHALRGLWDHFDRRAPHAHHKAPVPGGYNAYEEQDLYEMARNAPQVTHLSPDTYATAAIYATRMLNYCGQHDKFLAEFNKDQFTAAIKAELNRRSAFRTTDEPGYFINPKSTNAGAPVPHVPQPPYPGAYDIWLPGSSTSNTAPTGQKNVGCFNSPSAFLVHSGPKRTPTGNV